MIEWGGGQVVEVVFNGPRHCDSPYCWDVDPVRPVETDEEPWSVSLPDHEPRGWSMFGLEDIAGWWVVVTGAVAVALVAVLVVIGLRRYAS